MYNFDLFIHSNRKNKIPALVSSYTFRKHNPSLNISIENLEDCKLLMEHDKKKFNRKGKALQLNVKSSQSFFFVRFICCELAKNKKSKKWILIIDPDIFCFKSINILNNFIKTAEQNNKSIIAYNNLSSFMLINTDKINWTETNIVNNIFHKNEDADNYMFLKKYYNDILPIPHIFNSIDNLTNETICLHTSKTYTQPWKTGIRYFPSDLHNNIPNINETKNQVFGRHSSKIIEKITLNLFKQALIHKYFSIDDLKEEIQRENVRPDILKLIN